MNDKVWMLVHPKKGFWYSPPATSAKEAWDNARQWEQWILGGRSVHGWREEMFEEGWRAKPVTLALK